VAVDCARAAGETATTLAAEAIESQKTNRRMAELVP
jgi:hypothetical protein